MAGRTGGAQTSRLLRDLAAGKLPSEVPDDLPLSAELRELVAYLSELQSLALDTARGDLAPRVIQARGPVAGSLKALQAALRHLTWQTQRIAAGDLTPRVQFLGEFSESFNRMVDQLAEGRRYEIMLRQSQRLEAVGQLAAGLAHEINTPAQFVGDSVHFLKDAIESLGSLLAVYRSQGQARPALDGEGAPEADPIAAAEARADAAYFLEHAPAAAERAFEGLRRIAGLIEAMQEFSTRDPRRTQTRADLNHAITMTLTIASHELSSVAEVETDLEALPQVICDVTEIHQVLLNLLVNAAAAIREVGGEDGRRGSIRVSSRANGDRVEISISDTGGGIPETIRERIFDPFFTTRPVGQGRGQGLTIVHQIVVERHRGTVTFESEVGRGTTFVVTLPVLAPSPESSR